MGNKLGLLKITKAQGRLTLQDLGRVGWQSLGICQSGAADEHAFAWGNKLLGDGPNTAALEITLGQFSCEFTADTQIAITGAKAKVFINTQEVNLWRTHTIKAGDVLQLKMPVEGLLNYLCVKGGFVVRPVCNSLSQCEREGLGPFEGQPLVAGQYLGFTQHNTSTLWNEFLVSQVDVTRQVTTDNRAVKPAYIPNYNTPLELIFFSNSGNHSEHYRHAVAILKSTVFTVSTASNRMGYRLMEQSEAGELAADAALLGDKTISAGTALGCVQLPPNGEPIVLLKDRQTMGGYPMLGCISHLSAFKLAQRRPGQQVTFKVVDSLERQKNTLALHSFKAYFEGEDVG